jgi:hypothetical protein
MLLIGEKKRTSIKKGEPAQADSPFFHAKTIQEFPGYTVCPAWRKQRSE